MNETIAILIARRRVRRRSSLAAVTTMEVETLATAVAIAIAAGIAAAVAARAATEQRPVSGLF